MIDEEKPLCSVEGCEKKIKALKMCSAHYGRWYRHGDALKGGTPVVRYTGEVCSTEGCNKLANSKNMCKNHYEKYRLSQTDKTCIVEGCEKQARGTRMCYTHHRRITKYSSLEPLSKDKDGRRGPRKLSKHFLKEEYPLCLVDGCQNKIKYRPRTKAPYTSDVSSYCSTHLTRLSVHKDLQESVEVKYVGKYTEDTKERKCFQCGNRKPLEMFNRHRQGVLGRLSYCKTCHAQRATLRRIKKAKLPTDKTVTKAKLIEMYGLLCPYCSREMRTANSSAGEIYDPLLVTFEHIIPVESGGGHTFCNVVLACWECNIKKSDTHFLQYLLKRQVSSSD